MSSSKCFERASKLLASKCKVTSELYHTWIMNIVLIYKTSILSIIIAGVQMLMGTCKFHAECRSHEFLDCLDHEFLNLLKLTV